MKICDLHSHSVFSDGTLTPEEIVSEAKNIGLSAIALTDHNTTKGDAYLKEAAEMAGIDCSCGIEITTEYNGEEIHLVGHFIKPSMWDEMEKFVEKRNEMKEQSNRECIDRLRADGYDLTYEEMAEMFPDMTHNRVHIARLLIKHGLVSEVSEGFEKFLNPEGKYYREAPKLTLPSSVEMIKKCGGVPVVAHPLLNVDRDIFPEFAEYCKKLGIVGMETMYTLFDDDDNRFMENIVNEYGFLPSGGSDFHGTNKKGIKLGVGYGNLCIPYEYYVNLKAFAK